MHRHRYGGGLHPAALAAEGGQGQHTVILGNGFFLFGQLLQIGTGGYEAGDLLLGQQGICFWVSSCRKLSE